MKKYFKWGMIVLFLLSLNSCYLLIKKINLEKGLSNIIQEVVEPRAAMPLPTSAQQQTKPLQEQDKSAQKTKLTDDQIRKALIQNSINQYSGSCPCPYFSDRGGRRCGGRSAWSRPGGASPLCYSTDISDKDVLRIRQSL